MGRLQITFIDDDELPAGTDWAMVKGALGERVLFVKRSCCVQDCGRCPIRALVLPAAPA